MRRTSFLVFPLCILKCIGPALTICIVNKHEEGEAKTFPLLIFNCSVYEIGKSGTPSMIVFYVFFFLFFYEKRKDKIIFRNFSNLSINVSGNGGSVDRLQCFNVTLETVFNETTDSVRSILIFNSNLRYIPERAFARYAKHLQSLNMHHCRINDIHLEGFDSLANLRKLGLPNNNITRVREAWFKDLVYLEQLDLSFNRIDIIEPVIFGKIPLLKRLDIRENRLTCLEPSTLPGGIDKVYFFGNPLTFKCRGKVSQRSELEKAISFFRRISFVVKIRRRRGDAIDVAIRFIYRFGNYS